MNTNRARDRSAPAEIALVDAELARVEADTSLGPLRREAAIETLRRVLAAEGAR